MVKKRKVKKIFILTGIIYVICILFSCTTSKGDEQNMNKESINENAESVKYPVPDKIVALTFDDGPNRVTTMQVLDILEQYKIKASFFLIGQNITESLSTVIKRQVELGCEICSHSYTHSDMTKLSIEAIKEEMDKTSSLIEKYAGYKPAFFRPPFISVNSTMYEAIDIPFICGIGASDWEESVSADKRAETILSNVQDGAIILLHDFLGNSKTVEALKTIIPGMLAQGYEFVTVSELFNRTGADKSGNKIWTIVK